MNRKQLAEQIIASAHAQPDSRWHISRNTDGGAAAEDFIRNYDARNARSQADKAASAATRWQAVLAELDDGGDDVTDHLTTEAG